MPSFFGDRLIETNDQQSWRELLDEMKMKNDDAKRPTPEMFALVASYKGPVTQIPKGKRTRRGPSKKPGESGSKQGHWTEKLDRQVWGD